MPGCCMPPLNQYGADEGGKHCGERGGHHMPGLNMEGMDAG